MSNVNARRVLKASLFGVCLVPVAPLILLVRLQQVLGAGESLFTACSQLLSLFPGGTGARIRAAFYWGTLERCSWETHVGFGSIFTHRGASLGAKTSLGSYCVIGHANIGSAVMMASRVSVPSGKRQHLDDEGRLASTTRFDTVTIGDGTWVGEGAIIMADVGRQCIVSAGAVVSKEMPDSCLIGGNPARVLKAVAHDIPVAAE